MLKGTVKWFNNAKGFGFVVPAEGNGDVFVHYTAIEMSGYRTLKPGQPVLYTAQMTDNGLHAVTLTVVEDNDGEKAEDSAYASDDLSIAA